MTLSSETEVRISELLDGALQAIEDQVLVSSGKCVDALLDLYGSTEDDAVRLICSDALRRVSRVSLVRADEFRADLQAVAAAAATASVGELLPEREPVAT